MNEYLNRQKYSKYLPVKEWKNIFVFLEDLVRQGFCRLNDEMSTLSKISSFFCTKISHMWELLRFFPASLFVQLSPCLDPPRQTSLITCFQAGRDPTKNSIYSTWETEKCTYTTSWSLRQKYLWLKVMTSLKSYHPPSDSEWTLVTR